MTKATYTGTTVDSVVQYTDEATGTSSRQIQDLRKTTAGLRDIFNMLSEDSTALHQTAQDYDLNDRAAIKSRIGAANLLDELYSKRGMGWNDIAKAVGVSLSAVRKWRNSGECTAENRLALARVAALLDLVEEAFVVDPGGWLLTPVIADADARYVDLLGAGRFDLVLDCAFQRMTATQALDAFDPDWRTTRWRRFDVVLDDEGVRSLRRR